MLGRFALVVGLVFSGLISAEAGTILHPVPGTGSWNTVSNGGFESGTMAGWPALDPPANFGRGVFQASSQQAWSGTYSARATTMNAFNGFGYSNLTNVGLVSVVVGQRYVLSGFFLTGELTSGSLYLDLSDAVFESQTASVISQPGWQFAWTEFTPLVNALRVRLVRDGQVKVGEYGYVDEVGVTPLSSFRAPNTQSAVVPEPTSLALCVAGGVGVAWQLTRKRQQRSGSALRE